MKNKYYVYAHINPLKNEIFYIGKGKDNRAYVKYNRSKWWKKTVNKYGYIIDILEEELTEKQVIERERWYINRIGRKDLGKGPLVNMTDGGEGSEGYKYSKKTRKKMSNAKKGKKHSEETRKKMCQNNGKGNLGKKLSEETRKKMSESKKGNIPWNKGITKFKTVEEKLISKRNALIKHRNKLKKEING